jgi:hypothetical protein
MPIDPKTGKEIPYFGYGAGPGGPGGPLQAVPQAQGMPQQTPLDPSQGSIDPELAATLLGTYGDQMELSALDEQMAKADALRSLEGGPEGRNAGRTFVAANPLEHVGKAMQQWEGRKRAKDIEPKRTATRTRIGENVKKYGLNLPE